MDQQTYASHRRFYPLYHFVAFPILLINVVVAAVQFARNPGLDTAWIMVVAIGLLIGIYTARAMPLKAQDRIIRFEERTRLERLLPPNLRSRMGELRASQLIALRFAPDDEVPELTQRALDGELKTPADIKRAIRNWRADHFRM